MFPFPSVSEQERIITTLNKLSSNTQRLETLYQQKLDDLVELKQSILKKAFAGELISEFKRSRTVKAIKSLEVKTTSPEFAAKVLAFAYQRHVATRRDKTYGHVKAQKTLHLVESIGGVEMGREPEKDAAGPNDFQHMLGAEDWAKEKQFFEFVERGKGYDFKKLGRYKEMIAEAIATIEPYRKELDKIVDLVAPMNSREA